jgi:hypothetical protein
MRRDDAKDSWGSGNQERHSSAASRCRIVFSAPSATSDHRVSLPGLSNRRLNPIAITKTNLCEAGALITIPLFGLSGVQLFIVGVISRDQQQPLDPADSYDLCELSTASERRQALQVSRRNPLLPAMS